MMSVSSHSRDYNIENGSEGSVTKVSPNPLSYPQTITGKWWCLICTLINSPDTKSCLACGNIGFWRCKYCTQGNELNEETCKNCHQSRALFVTIYDDEDDESSLNVEQERNYSSVEKTNEKIDNTVENKNENNANVSKEKDECLEEIIKRKVNEKEDDIIVGTKRKRSSYEELLELEKDDFVSNTISFECPICFIECEIGKGIILKECLHTFCQECIKQLVKVSTEAVVRCPFGDGKSTCSSILQEREIKALVEETVFCKYLSKSLAEAESRINNTFHCKTPDCPGWGINDNGADIYLCPVCCNINCLNCQAIHPDLDCSAYKNSRIAKEDEESGSYKTKEMLQKMLDDKLAMNCPQCGVIVTKSYGCDWIMCIMCKTEICWATRGPRWGPKGYGDTSGGCRCRVYRKICVRGCQKDQFGKCYCKFKRATCTPECRDCH